MKKFTFLILCLLLSINAICQGHYGGQYSVSINGGIQNNQAIAGNINIQKLFKNNYFGIRADLMFTTNTETLNVIVREDYTLKTYNVGASAFYTFEKFIKHPFYINIYLGGNYTHEILNDKIYKNSFGIEFTPINENVFGIYGGAEFEYMFYKNLSFCITSLNQYQLNSDFDAVRSFGLAGFKYNF